MDFLTFHVGEREFAVEMDRVREIVTPPPITRVPGMPPALLGLIGLRGDPTAVVDAGLRLAGRHVLQSPRTPVIVLSVRLLDRPFEVGLLVEAAGRKAQVEELLPWSEGHARFAGSDACTGFADVEGRLVLVLDVDRLLSFDRIAAASAMALPAPARPAEAAPSSPASTPLAAPSTAATAAVTRSAEPTSAGAPSMGMAATVAAPSTAAAAPSAKPAGSGSTVAAGAPASPGAALAVAAASRDGHSPPSASTASERPPSAAPSSSTAAPETPHPAPTAPNAPPSRADEGPLEPPRAASPAPVPPSRGLPPRAAHPPVPSAAPPPARPPEPAFRPTPPVAAPIAPPAHGAGTATDGGWTRFTERPAPPPAPAPRSRPTVDPHLRAEPPETGVLRAPVRESPRYVAEEPVEPASAPLQQADPWVRRVKWIGGAVATALVVALLALALTSGKSDRAVRKEDALRASPTKAPATAQSLSPPPRTEEPPRPAPEPLAATTPQPASSAPEPTPAPSPAAPSAPPPPVARPAQPAPPVAEPAPARPAPPTAAASAPARPAPAAPPAAAPAPAPAAANRKARSLPPELVVSADTPPCDIYAVKRGDTLWAISAMRLGDPYKWPKVYGENRDHILNPDLIEIDDRIRIPGACRAADK